MQRKPRRVFANPLTKSDAENGSDESQDECDEARQGSEGSHEPIGIDEQLESLRISDEHTGGNTEAISDNVLSAMIEQDIDNLLERRFREHNKSVGLQHLAGHLLDVVGSSHIIADRCETLFSLICQTFRRGTPLPIRLLGAQALSSLALASCNLIEASGSLARLFEQLCKDLIAVIANGDEDPDVRRAYLNCLCTYQLLGFGEQYPLCKRELMQLMQHIFEPRINNESDQFIALVELAMFNWSVLIPSLLDDDHEFATSIIDRFLDRVYGFMQSPVCAIQLVSAQSLALIDELLRGDSRIEFKISKELKRIVSELANEANTKSQTKKDQLARRTIFRSVERSVNEHIYTCDIVKIGRKHQIPIDSWLLRFRYYFLLKILGNKLELHLRANEMVAFLMNYDQIEKETAEDEFETHRKLNNSIVQRQLAKERDNRRRNARNKKLGNKLL